MFSEMFSETLLRKLLPQIFAHLVNFYSKFLRKSFIELQEQRKKPFKYLNPFSSKQVIVFSIVLKTFVVVSWNKS